MEAKSKSDRVAEAVDILTKLKKVGIPTSEPGYKITKQALDIWIATGAASTTEAPFPRYGRTGIMVLPEKASEKASYLLRADSAEAAESADDA
jgi:hypothetical protein